MFHKKELQRFKSNLLDSRFILFALILLNFIVKGAYLSSNSLGGDEPFSVYYAQMDTSALIQLIAAGNNPPLYELLLKGWINLFGISEFSVRFPSLLFSCLTVLYLYKLGTQFLSKQIGIYTCVFFIFSNYHIEFAHEARVYALLGLLSIASMYYFLIIFKSIKEGNIGYFKIRYAVILLIILDTLIIYAHYFGFFILITQFLFLVFNKQLLIRYFKPILGGVLIIALFYLPNIITLLNRFFDSSQNGTWVSEPNGIVSIYNMLWNFSNAPVVTVLVILLFITCIVKFIIGFKKSIKNSYVNFIVFWFVFIFSFMFIASYWVPMFMDRYLMPAAIPFYLLLGISTDLVIHKNKFKWIIPVVFMTLFSVTFKPNFSNKRNVKEVVEMVKKLKDENTLVIISPAHFNLNFVYYYNREVFRKFNNSREYININAYLKSNNMVGANHIDEVDFKNWNKIVFLDAASNFAFPNNNIKNRLDTEFSLRKSHYFYEIFYVYEYQKLDSTVQINNK